MTLAIVQTADRIDRRLWQWEVWLDGPSAELDEIEEVIYTLHPSFPEPVQRTTDRGNRFRLSEHGWGEFRLRARLRKKDGSEKELQHWLRFPSNRMSDRETPPRGGPRSIYLSFAVADGSLAQTISQALSKRGILVTRSDDASPGIPMGTWVGGAIERADATVVLVTRRFSNWMAQEVERSLEVGKPVLGIMVYGPFGPPEVPSELRDLQLLQVKLSENQQSDAKEVAERIVQVFTARADSA